MINWCSQTDRSTLPESVYEPRDCLHLVIQFHRRCQEALKSMIANANKDAENGGANKKVDKVFTSIVDKQLQELDMKLHKYREVF